MKTVILKRDDFRATVVRTYKETIPLSVGDVILVDKLEHEIDFVRLNMDEQQLEIEYYEYK